LDAAKAASKASAVRGKPPFRSWHRARVTPWASPTERTTSKPPWRCTCLRRVRAG